MTATPGTPGMPEVPTPSLASMRAEKPQKPQKPAAALEEFPELSPQHRVDGPTAAGEVGAEPDDFERAHQLVGADASCRGPVSVTCRCGQWSADVRSASEASIAWSQHVSAVSRGSA